jgi:hypothetical protein
MVCQSPESRHDLMYAKKTDLGGQFDGVTVGEGSKTSSSFFMEVPAPVLFNVAQSPQIVVDDGWRSSADSMAAAAFE